MQFKNLSRQPSRTALALLITASSVAPAFARDPIPLRDPPSYTGSPEFSIALQPPQTEPIASGNANQPVDDAFAPTPTPADAYPDFAPDDFTPASEPAPPTTAPILQDWDTSGIEGEIVRQRYPDGRMQTERVVAQDGDGNYVNHGRYQQWDRSGLLTASGEFLMGERHGAWFRIYQRDEAKLFTAYPYSELKAPFTSKVEFSNGVMVGTWIITDAEGRTASEVAFVDGMRNGPATWYHPSGEIMYRAEYLAGVLHGQLVEFDRKGKETNRSEFRDGQRVEIVTDTYPNQKPKSQYQFLSPPQQIEKPDQWWSAEPATYSAAGTSIKHGSFTTWYDNGQMRSQGHYESGTLQGAFTSWFANGQREAFGQYVKGVPAGQWMWWHDNGMKRAEGGYEDGKPQGTWLSWQPDGKRVNGGQAQGSQQAAKSVLEKPSGTQARGNLRSRR